MNAGVLRIAVLTQYKSHSLDRHISDVAAVEPAGQLRTPVPAQRLGPRWYTGSADAIFQSLNLINDERPDIVVVFGADHVYRMDPRQMWRQHVDGGAGVTVAGIPVPRSEATAFGVIQTAQDGIGIEAFLEKPADPPGLPGRPDETYASMGNYVFSTEALLDALHTDAANEESKHDMGGDIVPMLVGQNAAQVYDFQSNEVPGEDGIGALLARRRDDRLVLCRAHGPLRDRPAFNLYNDRWPILTHPLVPPGQVRPQRRRPGGAGHRQHRLERRHRLRGISTGSRALPGAPAQLGDGGAVGDHGRRRRRPASRGPRRDPRQERAGRAGRRDRREQGRRPRPRFAVSDDGVTVVGKGVEVAK